MCVCVSYRFSKVPGIVGTGSLHALEVDTDGAVEEYKEVSGSGFVPRFKTRRFLITPKRRTETPAQLRNGEYIAD